MHLLCQANALRIPLADKSVHMCVTSPPYWGLRDYGTSKWVGGIQETASDRLYRCEDCGVERQIDNLVSGCPRCGQTMVPIGHFHEVIPGPVTEKYKVCVCGARRIDQQLGLEPTPDLFIRTMVEVFREVWRCLRDDGTCWVNIGSSYAAGGRGGNSTESNGNYHGHGYREEMEAVPKKAPPGYKPKDMVPIPWMLAMALQADGWYLRSDIIWAKPNPMPESVTDRPTKSHEYMFLLSKQERYYFDADAVREKSDSESGWAKQRANGKANWSQATQEKTGRGYRGEVTGNEGNNTLWEDPGNRNIRTVWSIPTESFPGAHFATYPRALVTPCIKAGTSEKGCCPVCGAGWVREVESERVQTRPGATTKTNGVHVEVMGNRDPGRHVRKLCGPDQLGCALTDCEAATARKRTSLQ